MSPRRSRTLSIGLELVELEIQTHTVLEGRRQLRMEKGRQLVDSNFAHTEGPFLASSNLLGIRRQEEQFRWALIATHAAASALTGGLGFHTTGYEYD